MPPVKEVETAVGEDDLFALAPETCPDGDELVEGGYFPVFFSHPAYPRGLMPMAAETGAEYIS